MSGSFIEIKVSHDKALKVKMMLDLQFAMISLLTISGAAGSPELLRDPDLPEDAVQIHKTPVEVKHGQKEKQIQASGQRVAIRTHPGSPGQKPVLPPLDTALYMSPGKHGPLRLEQPTSPEPHRSPSPDKRTARMGEPQPQKSLVSPEKGMENMPAWAFDPAC